MTLKPTIETLIAPTIESMDLVLWGCELNQAGVHTTLRVYVDGKEGRGVTLDACAQVSREIGALLDVEDLIKNHYQLEVSSPGVERPLFNASQYAKYIGSDVKVKLRVPELGRRQFVARIDKVENDTIFLVVEGDELSLNVNDIQKANLIMKVGS